MKTAALGNAGSAGRTAAQEKACAAEQTDTAGKTSALGPAGVCCRELGQMDYEACWKLQQTLFEALLARKREAAQKRRAAAFGPDGHTRPAVIGGNDAPAAGMDNGIAPGTDQAEEKHSGNTSGRNRNCGSDADKTSGSRSCDSSEWTVRQPEKAAAEAGTILLVEHPPVYTLGKSGHAENLLIGREALEKLGAAFFHIDRGGDITFHGPGQLVCYPILDLERLGIGLRQYIEALEEAVIRTLAHYGIEAGRIAGASGVWIGGGRDDSIGAKNSVPRKICAIGVRSSRYVTMHGFALNVTTDLEWFSRINPCGFTDRGVTSIERETGRKVPMAEVEDLAVNYLSEILNVKIYNY